MKGEFETPLVIGNAKNPRFFKNLDPEEECSSDNNSENVPITSII